MGFIFVILTSFKLNIAPYIFTFSAGSLSSISVYSHFHLLRASLPLLSLWECEVPSSCTTSNRRTIQFRGSMNWWDCRPPVLQGRIMRTMLRYTWTNRVLRLELRCLRQLIGLISRIPSNWNLVSFSVLLSIFSWRRPCRFRGIWWCRRSRLWFCLNSNS